MNENTYDVNFKKIIKNKSLLSYILKHYIEEYRYLSLPEIESLLNVNFLQELSAEEVQSLESEFNHPKYGKIALDSFIAVRLPDGSGQIGLLFDFEMQRNVNSNQSILKRATYYIARAISAQKGVFFKGMNYHKLLKVYGVWFCMIADEEEENSLTVYDTRQNSIIGDYFEKRENYDVGSIVLFRLSKDDIKDHFDALCELFLRKGGIEEKMIYLKENYGIDLEENKEEIREMLTPYEFFDLRYQSKYKKEGKAEGRVEGRLETLKNNIKSFMESTSYSLEEIMQMLNLSEDEKEYCRNELTK